jgi:hypothetical protein
MKVSYKDGLLYVQCSGKQFSDQVEDVKQMGMRYDPDERAWTISAGKLNEVLNDLSIYNVEISEWDRLEIKKYYESLDELKRIDKRSEYRKFNPELLKESPL